MKTKGTKADVLQKSLSLIEETHELLYAIESIGKGYSQNAKTDVLAVRHSVRALSEEIRGKYCDAADALAHLKHPASEMLHKACDALDYLQFIVTMADYSSDGNRPGQSRMFRVAIGRVILSFVSEAGRWMERATEALGDKGPHCGWLDGLMCVEGVPEDSFRRLDAQEEWLLREFRPMPESTRRTVAEFISTARKAVST
jgi:hypothetical protein